MKLLQNSWSEMLILDQIHQRLHNHLPDETTLHNGQKFELLSLALLGVPSMAETFQEITNKFTALKFDSADYVCLKFVLLLCPGKYNEAKLLCFILWIVILQLICEWIKLILSQFSRREKFEQPQSRARVQWTSAQNSSRILRQLLPQCPGTVFVCPDLSFGLECILFFTLPCSYGIISIQSPWIFLSLFISFLGNNSKNIIRTKFNIYIEVKHTTVITLSCLKHLECAVL